MFLSPIPVLGAVSLHKAAAPAAPRTFTVLNTAARLAATGLRMGDTFVQACAAVDAITAAAQVVSFDFSTSFPGGSGVDQSFSVGIPGGTIDGFTNGDTALDLATTFFNQLSYLTNSFSINLTAVQDGLLVTYTALAAGAVSAQAASGFGATITILIAGRDAADAIAAGSGPGDGTYLVIDPAQEGTEGAFQLQP